MAESSDTEDGVTLYNNSEGSYGGCIVYSISDDELTLPNYMTHAPPSNDIIYQVDVIEEMKKLEMAEIGMTTDLMCATMCKLQYQSIFLWKSMGFIKLVMGRKIMFFSKLVTTLTQN